jgi:diguanylate cyclase (GGDEF)-like protein
MLLAGTVQDGFHLPIRNTFQARSRFWLEFVVRPKVWQCCVMMVLVASLVYASQLFFVRITFFEGRWAVWWPMNGIALGTLLRVRRRHWPWILMAFAIGVAFSEAREPIHVIAIVAVFNMLEVLWPALVLPRFRTMDKWLAQPGLAARFILVAVLAAPLTSSLLAPLYYSNRPGESYWITALRWGAGDVLGVALFTPLVLALFSPEMWRLFRPAALPQTLGSLTLMAGASWFVFHQQILPVSFALYPAILMVSTQLGLSGATIALDLLAVIATDATLRGIGPFGSYGEDAFLRVALLQLFLVLSLLMTMPVSVARVRRLTTEAQLRRAWQQMEALASLDGLTGVANRRRFDAVFAQEWARARREQSPVALLMIDTDQFKAFNDGYGHLAGDACLRSVAQAIAEVPGRPGDLVARYGGEEFAVLLPGSDASGAFRIAEAVRQAVYALGLPHHATEEQRVTVSIGVASMVPVGEMEPDELIAASDRALYEAKHTGRNRVKMAFDLIADHGGHVPRSSSENCGALAG